FTTKLGIADLTVAKELVRVNHVRNCMMCHAPSLDDSDLVRAGVPDPRRPSSSYGASSLGQFVRADITYVKQDFSVPLQVTTSGRTHQRFDYLVRNRVVPPAERLFGAVSEEYSQRESVVFALRELTGQDHGMDARDWSTALAKVLASAGARK